MHHYALIPSLLSGTTGCYRLVLSFPCPCPAICHFSKEPTCTRTRAHIRPSVHPTPRWALWSHDGRSLLAPPDFDLFFPSPQPPSHTAGTCSPLFTIDLLICLILRWSECDLRPAYQPRGGGGLLTTVKYLFEVFLRLFLGLV